MFGPRGAEELAGGAEAEHIRLAVGMVPRQTDPTVSHPAVSGSLPGEKLIASFAVSGVGSGRLRLQIDGPNGERCNLLGRLHSFPSTFVPNFTLL